VVIAIAPAIVFVVTHLGRPANPIEIALVCSVLVDVGLAIGTSYLILDMLIFLLLLYRSRRVPVSLSLALFLAALSIAIYIGMYSEVRHPGSFNP
jgi:hypothetical protein